MTTTIPNAKLSTKTNVTTVTTVPVIESGTPKLVPVTVVQGSTIVNAVPNPVFTSATGITGRKLNTITQATQQDQANFAAKEDWRVRLSLAPGSNYLYNAASPGILQPLTKTNGVIFPYTPQISISYNAAYEQNSLVHTNYRVNQYTSSSVDQVTITCDFTAQDIVEANYLLAVIHFFRTMTKMFYGQDDNPKNGTPPPLCYIFGLGEFQFSALPLAISSFNYSLPNDVDYIKTTGPSAAGSPQSSIEDTILDSLGIQRSGGALLPGGKIPGPKYETSPSTAGISPTYVPTKIQLSITCLPIMSRNMISNKFSLKDYASGKLLQGNKNPGGGMW